MRQNGASEVSKSTDTSIDETLDEAPAEQLDDLDETDILEALKAEVRRRRRGATEHATSNSERAPKAAVRYFEETPDGIRTEIEDSLVDETGLEALESELTDMEPDMESFVKSLVAGSPTRDSHNHEANAILESHLKAQFEQLKKLDLEKLSEADLLRIRGKLLKDGEEGIYDPFHI